MSLMNIVKKYEKRKGKLIEQKKRIVVFAFPSHSIDISSQYYRLYCKHTLIKHKQWRGQVFNAWDGTIVDPETGQTTDDKELDIFKTTYKNNLTSSK